MIEIMRASFPNSELPDIELGVYYLETRIPARQLAVSEEHYKKEISLP